MTPTELRQKLRAMERRQGRFENELGLVSYSGDVLALTDAQADALIRELVLEAERARTERLVKALDDCGDYYIEKAAYWLSNWAEINLDGKSCLLDGEEKSNG